MGGEVTPGTTLSREHAVRALWIGADGLTWVIAIEEAVFLGDRVVVMSPRPGRVILDEPVEISAKHGRLLPGKELRSTPEFVELRDRIADAIYAGQAPS